MVKAAKALRATVAPNRMAVFQTDVVGRADLCAKAAGGATVGGVERLGTHFEAAEKRVDDARFQKLLAFLQITVDGSVGSDGRHNPFERGHGIGLFFLFKFDGVGVETREHHVGVGHLHRVDVAALPTLASEQLLQHSVCQTAVIAASQNAVNQIVVVVFDSHFFDEPSHNPRNAPRVYWKHEA